jgi:hypothetical protein
MPDKSKVGEPDCSRVSAAHEVSQVAQKYGISSVQARKLIERFGNDREILYAAVETLKQGRHTYLAPATV